MTKLLWWLRRCWACRDETIELVDKDTLKLLDGARLWDEAWRTLPEVVAKRLEKNVGKLGQ